jgi:Ca2+-binding RTX toxin-like protein
MATSGSPLVTKAPPNLFVYTSGTSSSDDMFGSDYRDEMHGGNGNDFIYGGFGDDVLYGEGDRDTLYGEQGSDTLYGGAGDDTLNGGAGGDRLDGGTGIDTISYAGARDWGGVTIDLTAGKGFKSDAQDDTYVSIENVVGTRFDDILLGDAGNNTLSGGDGADKLYGGIGEDILIGGAGDDLLTGDPDGFASRDTFVFTPGGGCDHIARFDDHDNIQVRGFGHDAFGADHIVAIWDSRSDTIENLDGDKFLYDTRNGILWEVDHAEVIDGEVQFDGHPVMWFDHVDATHVGAIWNISIVD